MIRAHLQTTLHRLLEQHRFFAPEDFLIEQSSTEFGGVVTYRHAPAFRFRVYQTTKRIVTNPILGLGHYEEQKRVNSKPGDIAPEEDVEIASSRDLENAFTHWLDNLHEELAAGPVLRQMEDQRRQIEGLLRDVASISEDYFSKEEADEMQTHLTRLQEQFASLIDTNASDKADVERMLTELRETINTLRQQVELLTKR